MGGPQAAHPDSLIKRLPGSRHHASSLRSLGSGQLRSAYRARRMLARGPIDRLAAIWRLDTRRRCFWYGNAADEVATVTCIRQATVRSEPYDPYVRVGELDCWPDQPRWELLENGAVLARRSTCDGGAEIPSRPRRYCCARASGHQ
jgi:hypothetical protein